MFTGKRQTLEQFEAFDYYYSLGAVRNLAAVAAKFNKGRSTIHDWSRLLHWQERVQRRDELIFARLQQITDTILLEEKEKIRAGIKESKLLIQAIMENSREKLLAGQVTIKSVKEINSIVLAIDRLIRCDLMLR